MGWNKIYNLYKWKQNNVLAFSFILIFHGYYHLVKNASRLNFLILAARSRASHYKVSLWSIITTLRYLKMPVKILKIIMAVGTIYTDKLSYTIYYTYS